MFWERVVKEGVERSYSTSQHGSDHSLNLHKKGRLLIDHKVDAVMK